MHPNTSLDLTLDNHITCTFLETKLAYTQCPQNMKAEKTSAGHEVFFTYKHNNARFIWPVSMKS